MAEECGGDPDRRLEDGAVAALVVSCWPSSVSIDWPVTVVEDAKDSPNPIRTSLTNGINICVDSSSELRKKKEKNLIKFDNFN